jgi:hypothetical protein
VGHEIGRNTIKRILASRASTRRLCGAGTSRGPTFIKAHLGAIAATDFLSAEVLTVYGLVRFHILFVIDVATRRVEIAGITRSPHCRVDAAGRRAT